MKPCQVLDAAEIKHCDGFASLCMRNAGESAHANTTISLPCCRDLFYTLPRYSCLSPLEEEQMPPVWALLAKKRSPRVVVGFSGRPSDLEGLTLSF